MMAATRPLCPSADEHSAYYGQSIVLVPDGDLLAQVARQVCFSRKSPSLAWSGGRLWLERDFNRLNVTTGQVAGSWG